MFGKREGFAPSQRHDSICTHHSPSEDVENAFGDLARLFELDQLAALDICDLISASLSKARENHPMLDEEECPLDKRNCYLTMTEKSLY